MCYQHLAQHWPWAWEEKLCLACISPREISMSEGGQFRPGSGRGCVKLTLHLIVVLVVQMEICTNFLKINIAKNGVESSENQMIKFLSQNSTPH